MKIDTILNIFKKILLISALILFVLIFAKFFNVLLFPDSETILKKGEIINLQPSFSLTQTFVANRDNLTKVEFMLRTPGPKDSDVVKIEIADETCSNIIRQDELKQSFLNSDNLYDFQFSKIPDSNDKTYCLKATFAPGHADSQLIKFFTAENHDSKFVLTDMNGKKIEKQSLSIRLAYRNDTLSQDVSELNQRISQYKPWFLKHFYLDAISILFVVLSIGLVTVLILL